MTMVKFLIAVILLYNVLTKSCAGPEYDFENGQERFTFKALHSHVRISNIYHKSGNKSLLWQWSYKTTGGPYAKLVIDFRKSVYIKGQELKEGGLKIWLYRQNIIIRKPSRMEIIFQGKSIHQQTAPTVVNLNFFGWRSLWISYKELGDEVKKLGEIRKVKFIIKTLHEDDVFFDLVRFVTSVTQPTRDYVLQKVGKGAKKYSSLDEQAQQRSLKRTYALNVPHVDAENKMTKSKEIRRILNRFDNWYAKSDESLSVKPRLDNAMYDTPTRGTPFQVYKDKRWFTLKQDIKAAHELYEMIDFTNKRPELFPLNSKYGENNINNGTKGRTKFGFVFDKVLLPLALDYHLMDRDVEVRELARQYCTKLESIHYKNKSEAAMAIAGDTPFLTKSFMKILHKYQKNNSLDCATYKKGRFKEPERVLHKFNDEVRLQRVIKLFDFIEEQGWSEGSGLGSLHKELDQSGSGIMHSIFLIRNGLNRPKYKKRLQKLIKTMKWYTDFKEIFEKEGNYVYYGRSAERMSTLLLYRLMIILINPNPKQQAKELKHFTKWFKSILKVNHGLGGVIKPDYTSWHHNTFYGSKYVPEGLHNAAFVQYLLEGTQFSLDGDSKESLRKALAVLRLVSGKYSTPNSINGAYPGYYRAILAKILPAYAYISFTQSTNSPTSGASERHLLLRLLNHKEPAVSTYLQDGHVPLGSYYMNTIGSIDVLQNIQKLKCSKKCSAENSPTGHFNLNFAAISVHRRKDWCVTAKGFNRYNYDFENYQTKNVYGVFANYGALQISNSEAALKAYDVTDGWDWTRVPGATTIKPKMLNRFITVQSGFYNPGKFAGGMRFVGSRGGEPRNGIFSMVYKNPKYKVNDYESALKTMQFEFKKSFFFYNDLIVCVGSDIKFKNKDAEHYYPQTTLFQDKLVDPFKSSRIYINGKPNDLSVLMETQTYFGAVALLIDTNGNMYQVKTPSAFGLNVKISDQESMTEDGRNITKARYATAFFKHKGEKGLLADDTFAPKDTQNDDDELKKDDSEDINQKYENDSSEMNSNFTDNSDNDYQMQETLPEQEDKSKIMENKNGTPYENDEEHKSKRKQNVKSRQHSAQHKSQRYQTKVPQKLKTQTRKTPAGNFITSKQINNYKNTQNSIGDSNTMRKNTAYSRKFMTSTLAAKVINDQHKKKTNNNKISQDSENDADEAANNYNPSLNTALPIKVPMTSKTTDNFNAQVNQTQGEFANNSTMPPPDVEQDQDNLYDTENSDEDENENVYGSPNDGTNDYPENYDPNNDDSVGMEGLGDESFSLSKNSANEKNSQKANRNDNKTVLGSGESSGEGYKERSVQNTKQHKEENIYREETNDFYGNENFGKSIYKSTPRNKDNKTNDDDDDDDSSDNMYSSEHESFPPMSSNEATSEDTDYNEGDGMVGLGDESYSSFNENNNTIYNSTNDNLYTENSHNSLYKSNLDNNKNSGDDDDDDDSSDNMYSSKHQSFPPVSSDNGKTSEKDDYNKNKNESDFEDGDAMDSLGDESFLSFQDKNNTKKNYKNEENDEQLQTAGEIYGNETNDLYSNENTDESIYDSNSKNDGNDDDHPDNMYSSRHESFLPISSDKEKSSENEGYNMNTTNVDYDTDPMVGVGDEGFSYQQESNIQDENTDVSPDNIYAKENFTETMYNGQHKNKEDNDDNNDSDNNMYSSQTESFPSVSSNGEHIKSNPQHRQRSRVPTNFVVKALEEKRAKQNVYSKNIQTKPPKAIKGDINDIYKFLKIYHKISKLPLVKKLLQNIKSVPKPDIACKNSLTCSKGHDTKEPQTLSVGLNSEKEDTSKSNCKNGEETCVNPKQEAAKGMCGVGLACKAENAKKVKNGHDVKLSEAKTQIHTGRSKEENTLHDNKKKKEEKLATGSDSYQYGILVKNGNPILLASYQVVSGQGKMHMVNFKLLPDIPPTNQVFAYSVFDKGGASMSSGPVVSVTGPCLIMAEISALTPTHLYLAINVPNIEYENDPSKNSDKRCKKTYKNDIKDIFSPKNVDELSEKMKFCVRPKKASDITVALNIKIPKDKLIISIVTTMVDGKMASGQYARLDSADITKVIFSNFINGLTTEAHIVYFPRPQ